MSITPAKKGFSTTKKIVATSAILIGVGAMVAGGAFAVFTASATGTLNASAGKTFVTMSSTVKIRNMAPSDVAERLMTIKLPKAKNAGDLVASVDLSAALPAGDEDLDMVGNDPYGLVDGESLLTGEKGLQYELLTCSVPWVSDNAPKGEYRCGTDDTVTPTLIRDGSLNSLFDTAAVATMTPGSLDLTPSADGTFNTTAGDVNIYAMIRIFLCDDAGNGYQGASTQVDFVANAVQRASIQK